VCVAKKFEGKGVKKGWKVVKIVVVDVYVVEGLEKSSRFLSLVGVAYGCIPARFIFPPFLS
jgi:hypothetical protein